MAYNVTVIGQSNLDAFGRTRVSNPVTIFDSKQLFDGRTIFWSTSTATGGSITFDGYRASSSLAATSTPGSEAVKQTKRRFNYSPGKSLEIMNTFVMGASVSGMRKRVGYFDVYNGIFFQDDGGTLSFVIRSNVTATPVDTVVTQANWNIDKLNGTGSSGITLDITKAQIMIVDLEWLGVGRVRVGFVINGAIYYAHQFLTSNVGTSVYMSSPNLPLRYEITNVSAGSGSSLEQICSTVVVEGDVQEEGILLSADRGATALASVDNAALYPLVSIRLDNTKPGATVTPASLSVLATTTGVDFKWALIINPTIGGSDAASWTSITGSAVQYDVSRTLTNTVSGGIQIASGYGNDSTVIEADFNTILSLGLSLAYVSDELVLAVQKIGAGTDSFVGSLSWREFE